MLLFQETKQIFSLYNLSSPFIADKKKITGEREMGRVHFESADQRTLSVQEKPNDKTSNTVLQEHEEQGGIQEAWSEIKNRGENVGGYLAAESRHKLEKKKSQVLLEGYVEAQENLTRGKSLTDDDLEELKGCLDLGFGFSYDEIPELCNTLPALELCYSMSQKFLDDKLNHQEDSPRPPPTTTSPVANWKISSPGDNPDDVKARLKYWAQTVACTVRLCS